MSHPVAFRMSVRYRIRLSSYPPATMPTSALSSGSYVFVARPSLTRACLPRRSSTSFWGYCSHAGSSGRSSPRCSSTRLISFTALAVSLTPPFSTPLPLLGHTPALRRQSLSPIAHPVFANMCWSNSARRSVERPMPTSALLRGSYVDVAMASLNLAASLLGSSTRALGYLFHAGSEGSSPPRVSVASPNILCTFLSQSLVPEHAAFGAFLSALTGLTLAMRSSSGLLVHRVFQYEDFV
mmetsp:Transcript_25890/g.60125  ORF Transcript_25890/g.60125 Transcript_25890/m.60125 type:complete len:239 (-) Transcript_25890:982-1698(-)